MKGIFSYHGSASSGRGGIVVSSVGLIIHQDPQLVQTYEKKKQESILIGAVKDSIFLLAHKNCSGEKCSCYMKLRTCLDNIANSKGAQPVTAQTFIENCTEQFGSSFGSLAIGCGNEIAICGEKRVQKGRTYQSLPLGEYSISMQNARTVEFCMPTFEERQRITKLVDPWIRGNIDSDAAMQQIASEMGKKALGVTMNERTGIYISKFGYRSKIWKPRGYISDYNFFTQRYRPLVVAERPELKIVEINSILGSLWQGLSKQEKRLFEDQAEADKIRYWKEVEHYNSCVDSIQQIVPNISTPVEIKTHESRKRKERVESSYNQFAHQEKQFIIGLNRPDLRQRMGLYIGYRWRHMCEEERKLYILLEKAKRSQRSAEDDPSLPEEFQYSSHEDIIWQES